MIYFQGRPLLGLPNNGFRVRWLRGGASVPVGEIQQWIKCRERLEILAKLIDTNLMIENHENGYLYFDCIGPVAAVINNLTERE